MLVSRGLQTVDKFALNAPEMRTGKGHMRSLILPHHRSIDHLRASASLRPSVPIFFFTSASRIPHLAARCTLRNEQMLSECAGLGTTAILRASIFPVPVVVGAPSTF